MKILIAPDSFKGSISAVDFCKVCESSIKKILPDAEIDLMPVADGGEGTLECIKKSVDCKIYRCYVQNSLYDEIEAEVAFMDKGKTALIESAIANGLPAIKGRENPEITSTYGVGQMVAFAVDNGAKKIILTLGGSSTNDCGLGLLAALGGCFYNKEGISFVPTGGTLKDVEEIDLSMMYPRLQGAKFEAMCDVKNPLCGKNGCSYVFGPQKGADEEMVKRLDEGCAHIASLFNKMCTTDFSKAEGAGAAGGLGFSVVAGLNGTLKSGIDTVLDLCSFEERIAGCDLIITGEGSFDSQSVMGKVIGGISKRCGKVPVAVFCGVNKFSGKLPENIVSVNEISKGQNLEYAMSHAKENLAAAVENYFKG